MKGRKQAGRQEVEDQVQTIVNSGCGPDYQIYVPLGWAPWVRVAYSSQTQKGPAKMSTSVDSNASCVTCFTSGVSSSKIAEFCSTLRLVYATAWG
jgi:hypothetical protein